MKNSQYANQFNININELVRLTFNEIVPLSETEVINNEITTISMHVEAAEVLANFMLQTINDHKEKQKQALKKMD